MTLKDIIKQYSESFPKDDEGREIIEKAYIFASNAHKGQKRESGEKYITHPHEVAIQLAKWKLDAETISAGLLHDVIEDCEIEPKELEKQFGKDILFLVNGVSKLGSLKYKEIHKRSAESLRKMIIAISKDIRVIFIKLADRLHNMKTLKYIQSKKQYRIALETTEIYSPIALRLGMQNLAGELEDIAFPYIYPKEYEWLKSNVYESYKERTKRLEKIRPIVLEKLNEAGINPIQVDYRAKKLYSLYRKLKRYDMNLNQIYDFVALRIIVKTVEECYSTMGIIHQLWPPLPGRIKDYISLPKHNGYQSLHTTVFSINGKPVEFQIRTMEMHEQAENGAAAHWFYESNKIYKDEKMRNKKISAKEMEWVYQLRNWQKQFSGSKEFVEALKIELFSDRIFALTPKGDVVDLPAGSTPIDLAYKIHSDLGNSCIGAKINNKITPLDSELQSGDVVEILTQKSKKPSESWIAFVKTANARKKIKNKLNKDMQLPDKYEYRIAGKDRPGLIKDILSIFSRKHLSIEEIKTDGKGKFPIVKLLVKIKNEKKNDEIVKKIKEINGVLEVGYKQIRNHQY